MNKKQRLVLTIGLFVIGGLGLYVPWEGTVTRSDAKTSLVVSNDRGYSFVWDLHNESEVVDNRVALPGDLIGQVRTELSQRASQLELRMTRPAVIRLLGAPTWASIPGDTGAFALEVPEIGLELQWKNRPCLPVVVAFDGNLRVNGWDEGRVCLDPPDLADPSAYYSCDKADRRRYCLAEPIEMDEADGRSR